MEGIKRLDNALHNSNRYRYQILYGPGIVDLYLNKSGVELNFEQALYEELSAIGFSRIIFFSPHRSLFALDEKSLYFFNEQNNNFEYRMESGPLDKYKAYDVKGYESRNPYGMGDVHALRILDTLMRDEKGPLTAIVFLQAETLLKNFDDRRILAGLIGEWIHLGSKNKNSCVITFSINDYVTLEAVSRELPVPELRNIIQNDIENLSLIDGAGEDEIKRGLQKLTNLGVYLKLEKEFANMLSKERKSLRTWICLFDDQRLKNKELDYKFAAELGWFSAVNQPGDPALKKLHDLIGLENVKKRIEELIAWAHVRSEKKEFLDNPPNLHMIFSGNPGTGKTTVARLIGEIYHELGWLKRGHLVEVQAGDLVAEYVGGTSAKTNKLIDRAVDGVLFIDEAYGLVESERGGFIQEALEILLARMESDRDKLVVICAGYVDKMQHFRQANPGLARRFPIENVVYFDDYDEKALWDILSFMLKSRKLEFDEAFGKNLKNLTHEMSLKRDRNFGNAGEMRNLSEALERVHSSRIVKDHLSMDTLLDITDIPENYKIYLPLSNVGLEKKSWELEIDQLIGLETIKKELKNLEKRLDYERLRYQFKEIDSFQSRIRNFAFVGNPGTGKTTVARLLGKMYKELGLLAKGHVVEVSRVDLVAGYVGQTAIKTQEVIENALDGVLFIDEAYALESGSENDYGKEAIQIIIKAMEDNRGRLGIVVAGYPDEIRLFLNSNPGLNSRFGAPLVFSDFSLPELWEILSDHLRRENYSFQEGFKNAVLKYLEGIKIRDGANFGNGRSVRDLFEVIKTNAGSRILDKVRIEKIPIEPEYLSTLISEDVPEPGFYLELGPVATTKAKANARV